MIKNLVKRYPGGTLLVMSAEILLIAVLIAVLSFRERNVESMRTSYESRRTALFLTDMEELSYLAKTDDGTLSSDERRLIFYQRAQSAVEMLAETGYTETAKRALTDVLNGISRHILNGEALSDAEVDFLRDFDPLSIESTARNLSAPAPTDTVDTGKNPHIYSYLSNREDARHMANKMFGVETGLSEWQGPDGNEYLFSCKNAYAVVNASWLYPVEAEICLPAIGAVYSADECQFFAERFLREMFPKKICRALSLVGGTDQGDRFSFLFEDKNEHTVTIGISKSSGHMVSVDARSLRSSGEDLT